MTKIVNLDGSDDPFYRYTRPFAIAGSRKGGTILLNTRQISRALDTKPRFLARCLSVYMNRRVSLLEENHQKFIFVTGAALAAEIDAAVTRFTRDLKLCRKCGNPETTVKRKKQRCKACGTKTRIENMGLVDRIENLLE